MALTGAKTIFLIRGFSLKIKYWYKHLIYRLILKGWIINF